MELRDKVVVVTGAGSGIGAALARRFADESPAALVLADINEEAVREVADGVGAHPMRVDVASAADNAHLVETTEERFGPIDLFCANAGIGFIGDEQTDPSEWNRMWEINTLSHIHAAKCLVPGWLARGEGYFLPTVSAAGLLTNLKAAQYSVTKHAALAFAEWLSVTYGDRGIKVSCLCPMGVDTPLLEVATEFHDLLSPHAISPADVADTVVNGLAAEEFLILPHADVARFFQNKANDYDRWIGGMRKLQRSVFPD